MNTLRGVKRGCRNDPPHRGWIVPIGAALILLGLGVHARADGMPVNCALVRQYVEEHGKARALAWALEQGYSWAQIREARRCLAR